MIKNYFASLAKEPGPIGHPAVLALKRNRVPNEQPRPAARAAKVLGDNPLFLRRGCTCHLRVLLDAKSTSIHASRARLSSLLPLLPPADSADHFCRATNAPMRSEARPQAQKLFFPPFHLIPVNTAAPVPLTSAYRLSFLLAATRMKMARLSKERLTLHLCFRF